jgi:hypothetical protein
MPPLNTPDRRAAQAHREITRFKDRDAWVCGVLADGDLTPGERVVGAYIGHSLIVTTGRCERSYDEIAQGVGMSRSTAIRGAAALIRRGWLAETTSRGRFKNNFKLQLVPANGVTNETVDSSVSDAVEPPHHYHQRHRNSSTSATVTVSPVTPAPYIERIGAKKRGKTDSPPTLLSANEENAQKESKPASVAAEFDQFWAAYPRRVAKENAR